MREIDFRRAPFLVIWETTQSCGLVCRHCRASARPDRDPFELSTAEARSLIDQVAAMGTPVLVMSGGDPLQRPDLFDLVRHGKGRGLRVATIPAATDHLTPDVVRSLREAGLDQMALSLDFPRADLHDAFRGVVGSFDRTVEAAGWAREAGLPLQINTTLCGESAPHLRDMADLVSDLGVVFWEIFFLVPVGRGTLLEGLSAEACEGLFEAIHEVQRRRDFIVKVTEAPHYRRFVAERQRREGRGVGHGGGVRMPAMLTRPEGPGHTIGRAPRGVNAGNGFLFVSHRGWIYPSGFLPIPAGHVRREPLADVYRDSPLFRQLREPESFAEPCGSCRYARICGGSRGRALALTGDPFGFDPWCAYGRDRPTERWDPPEVVSGAPPSLRGLYGRD